MILIIYKDIKHISSVIITTAEEWPKAKIEELKTKLLKSSITDENIEERLPLKSNTH